MDGNLEEHKRRFWSFVNKTESCWLWVGCFKDYGYGVFTFRRKVWDAHRLSWHFSVGEIPPGVCVLHNCPGGDDRACVNPAHLWLGTRVDNIRDKMAKGTSPKGWVKPVRKSRKKS